MSKKIIEVTNNKDIYVVEINKRALIELCENENEVNKIREIATEIDNVGLMLEEISVNMRNIISYKINVNEQISMILEEFGVASDE